MVPLTGLVCADDDDGGDGVIGCTVVTAPEAGDAVIGAAGPLTAAVDRPVCDGVAAEFVGPLAVEIGGTAVPGRIAVAEELWAGGLRTPAVGIAGRAGTVGRICGAAITLGCAGGGADRCAGAAALG